MPGLSKTEWRSPVKALGARSQRRPEAARRSWQFLRRVGLAVVLLVGGVALTADGPTAQQARFFRIGTGSTAGTYYPIGSILASAISKPPGSRECGAGGSCGVPGLIAVAQSTEGSVANIRGISSGTLESGFSQADVSFWAFNGEQAFAEGGAIRNLRTIANLFPESVHLVVSGDSGITSVRDIKGKRISLDRQGSGTRLDALLILSAYGLSEGDIESSDWPAGVAADMMIAGELDGFFMVAGTPANAVTSLAESMRVELVPIDGEEAQALQESFPFFAPDTIASGTYFNVGATHTLSVGAQWLVSAQLPADLVYGITRALWHKSTRRLLDGGHPKGQLVRLETALDGLVVPLHPGARRFYSEMGTAYPMGGGTTRGQRDDNEPSAPRTTE